MQSSNVNDFLKMKIDGHTEPQLVPKNLLQVSIRELHNNLVSSTIYDGIKEARDEDYNIIIIDSTLHSPFQPQLKIYCQDTRSCVPVNVSYLPKVCIRHYYHCVIFIKKNKGFQPKFSKQEFWEKIKLHI